MVKMYKDLWLKFLKKNLFCLQKGKKYNILFKHKTMTNYKQTY